MKKDSIKTSLIITTYNRPDALELVLLSALDQSVLPYEVIVADDGSTKDTALLVDRYKSKFRVPLKHCWHEDQGFRLSHIRNKAIAQSAGDYIVMIDGDVVLHHHFIRDHMNHRAPNRFIQGSRVLLSHCLTERSISERQTRFSPFSKGITNRLNAISNKLISPVVSVFYSRTQSHKGVRGCNMSYWKSDLIKVNGFSEEFVGWGREDSEFVVRMLNNGIQRYNLKIGGVVYHLWHKDNKNEDLLEQNNLFLEGAIKQRRTTCADGLGKYLYANEA